MPLRQCFVHLMHSWRFRFLWLLPLAEGQSRAVGNCRGTSSQGSSTPECPQCQTLGTWSRFPLIPPLSLQTLFATAPKCAVIIQNWLLEYSVLFSFKCRTFIKMWHIKHTNVKYHFTKQEIIMKFLILFTILKNMKLQRWKNFLQFFETH